MLTFLVEGQINAYYTDRGKGFGGTKSFSPKVSKKRRHNTGDVGAWDMVKGHLSENNLVSTGHGHLWLMAPRKL